VALYEASGDEAVLRRLLEMVRLVANKLTTKDDLLYGGVARLVGPRACLVPRRQATDVGRQACLPFPTHAPLAPLPPPYPSPYPAPRAVRPRHLDPLWVAGGQLGPQPREVGGGGADGQTRMLHRQPRRHTSWLGQRLNCLPRHPYPPRNASAWLISVTVDMLRAKGALPRAEAERFAGRLTAVAERSLREGYDARHGGVFEAGVPGAAPGEGEGARGGPLGGLACGLLGRKLQIVWVLEVAGATALGLTCSVHSSLARRRRVDRENLVDPGGRFWGEAAAGQDSPSSASSGCPATRSGPTPPFLPPLPPTQAESMLAMWEVFRRTGDCAALDKLKGTLEVRARRVGGRCLPREGWGVEAGEWGLRLRWLRPSRLLPPPPPPRSPVCAHQAAGPARRRVAVVHRRERCQAGVAALPEGQHLEGDLPQVWGQGRAGGAH
jgi:hypothetical protein